jgi:signal transduction histidine kinase
MSVLGPLERIPVRWRIAITCAGLTLLILVCFALVLGNLVGDRIRDDHEDELRRAAASLASETRVAQDPALGTVIESPRLSDFAMAEHAVIRVVDENGEPLAATDPRADLGPPSTGINDAGALDVATEPIRTPGSSPAYVQYALPSSSVNATIERLWFFLAAGVLGGTLLALLAGGAVANRAMRPIASLTRVARDITKTRDPSRRMPVRAADDEIGELATTFDEMLEALADAHEERERAYERQREFVGAASHELRTPLTTRQTNLELLQASLAGTGDERQAVDSALGSSRRMSRLVSDLLLLARADAGRRAARTEVDLSGIVSDALDEVESISGDHPISSELSEDLRVEGNPDELQRLARNLLENAVRHAPPSTRIELALSRDGGEAVLVVGDEGPGIPAELREQVFDRFVRGEAGPADTSGGGSGLGLAIVRAVAESHGGAVRVTDSSSGGARFEVRLSLRQGRSGGARAEAGASHPAERG